jgi:hypothetical protein
MSDEYEISKQQSAGKTIQKGPFLLLDGDWYSIRAHQSEGSGSSLDSLRTAQN